jgi:beta-glucosidase
VRGGDRILWGVATSAFQIEGSLDADGRGASIWDDFPSDAGETGAVACDHYRRWREDVDLIASLGVNSYRFSIAWPRLLPEGHGRVEQRGVDHYSRLIDALLERGIEPVVTLYHWDLPAAYDWRERRTAERFAEFATLCYKHYGDRVKWWLTINEPWIVGLLGFRLGLHAPGITDDLRGEVSVFHHLLYAHGLAAQASDREHSVGIALNLFPHYPASDEPADADAAHGSDGYTNRWFLDALYGRGYPDDMRERWERLVGPLDFVRDGDLATIAAPTG